MISSQSLFRSFYNALVLYTCDYDTIHFIAKITRPEQCISVFIINIYELALPQHNPGYKWMIRKEKKKYWVQNGEKMLLSAADESESKEIDRTKVQNKGQ